MKRRIERRCPPEIPTIFRPNKPAKITDYVLNFPLSFEYLMNYRVFEKKTDEAVTPLWCWCWLAHSVACLVLVGGASLRKRGASTILLFFSPPRLCTNSIASTDPHQCDRVVLSTSL
ncbi:hypothetical protein BT63DRAFT_27720 [Microthyrium microscopicum]|uniref:Uncharacterized protein n=1 Tax=Microthyrium microscopicum TaxID=703497 RepID=A0A6A6UUB0_9PEZI|nr:hypothetical protein BT63DRAFT_27720 [Microthyrium microscopicum]